MSESCLKRRRTDAPDDFQSLLGRRKRSIEEMTKKASCDCALSSEPEAPSCRKLLIEEVKHTVAESLAKHFESFVKKKKLPPKPFNGHLELQIPPLLHQKLHFRAEADNKSINQWMTDLLTNTIENK